MLLRKCISIIDIKRRNADANVLLNVWFSCVASFSSFKNGDTKLCTNIWCFGFCLKTKMLHEANLSKFKAEVHSSHVFINREVVLYVGWSCGWPRLWPSKKNYIRICININGHLQILIFTRAAVYSFKIYH
jgi:hypothetical protein